jgi:hypothetical protein
MAKMPPHHNEAWTPTQDKQLRKLAAGNTPTGLMAYELGRTEGAVRSHASDIGLSLKPTNQSPYGTGGKRKR